MSFSVNLKLYPTEFNLASLTALVVQQLCKSSVCFLTGGMRREDPPPLQSQQKGSGSAQQVPQCPNWEWASFFSTANNKKADSLPSSPVCAFTAK